MSISLFKHNEQAYLSALSMLQEIGKAAILGLSATAVHYLDNQRDMSDELFDEILPRK